MFKEALLGQKRFGYAKVKKAFIISFNKTTHSKTIRLYNFIYIYIQHKKSSTMNNFDLVG